VIPVLADHNITSWYAYGFMTLDSEIHVDSVLPIPKCMSLFMSSILPCTYLNLPVLGGDLLSTE